jgi:hypothetical protein
VLIITVDSEIQLLLMMLTKAKRDIDKWLNAIRMQWLFSDAFEKPHLVIPAT